MSSAGRYGDGERSSSSTAQRVVAREEFWHGVRVCGCARRAVSDTYTFWGRCFMFARKDLGRPRSWNSYGAPQNRPPWSPFLSVAPVGVR